MLRSQLNGNKKILFRLDRGEREKKKKNREEIVKPAVTPLRG